MKSHQEIFERVRDILVEYQCVKPEKVTLEADLFKNIGVAGNDADDIFILLDQEFEVDWTGLELCIHFGSEGLGLPLPWRLRNSKYIYQTQPFSVGQ